MVFLHLLPRHKFEKAWKFGCLVFFARINFREFVLAKNFARINFFRNRPKFAKFAKITSFKVVI